MNCSIEKTSTASSRCSSLLNFVCKFRDSLRTIAQFIRSAKCSIGNAFAYFGILTLALSNAKVSIA